MSFVFVDELVVIVVVLVIGCIGLVGECYCWDLYFVKIMVSVMMGIVEDLKILVGVVCGGGGLKVCGLFNVVWFVVVGKSVFDGEIYMFNLIVDDFICVGVDVWIVLLK